MRDPHLFPDDENGEVLWRMAQDGDNLDKAREIDFSVIFPSEEAAMQFATRLLRRGEKVSFGSHEGDDECPWQVEVHPVMLPTHRNVTDFENVLAMESESLAGRNDGWGCFSME
ncbi:ribonuclease E inhibitor RraB [Dokdonella sp. MW10]|uniref:ribonuclease E inhibitor RraB n=1 Tax=Dokdonella sp. MW10 TaxID=2992926 RepID=UPI003F8089EE